MKKIKCEIELVDTVHIGSGKMGIGTKRSIGIQKIRGAPFIPGSSIRGKMRWNLERFVSHFRAISKDPLLSFLQENPDDISVVSHLFGAENYPGRIVITDALPNSNVKTGTVPGIRIERETGTVSKGGLFFHEVIAPSSKFEFSIFIDTPKNDSTEQQRIDLFLTLFAAKSIERSGIGRHRGRILMDLRESETDYNSLMEEMLEK